MSKKVKRIFTLSEFVKVSRLYYGIRDNDDYLYKYSVGTGQEDRSMFNSPHFDFLDRYSEGRNLNESDYVKWLRSLGSDGEHIKNKVDRFINLFESIKKNGFYKHEFVTVFLDGTDYGISPEDNRPLVNKNNGKYPLYQSKCVDFEILYGHHRAACAAFLGIDKLKCHFYPSVSYRLGWLYRGCGNRVRRVVSKKED